MRGDSVIVIVGKLKHDRSRRHGANRKKNHRDDSAPSSTSTKLRKRWVRGRYRATRTEIAARYSVHRIMGEPEIRAVEDDPRKRFPTKPV